MRRVSTSIGIYSAVLALSATVTVGKQPAAAPPPAAPATQTPPAGATAPKNLKVLPKNWTVQQVRNLMQTFAESLGVMCTHCHAADPNAPPPAAGRPPLLDHSLDEKPEKEVARKMIQMVMSLNGDLKGMGDPAIEEKVSCFTCHQGAKIPPIQPAAGWGRGGFSLLPAGPPPARGRGGD
jgi:hypothetical protein